MYIGFLLLLIGGVRGELDVCHWAMGNASEWRYQKSQLIDFNIELENSFQRLSIMEEYLTGLYARDWYRPNGPAPPLNTEEQSEVSASIFDALANAQEVDKHAYPELRRVFNRICDVSVESHGAPVIASVVKRIIDTERKIRKETEQAAREGLKLEKKLRVKTQETKNLFDECFSLLESRIGNEESKLHAYHGFHYSVVERATVIKKILELIVTHNHPLTRVSPGHFIVILQPAQGMRENIFVDTFRLCFSLPNRPPNILEPQIERVILETVHAFAETPTDAVLHALMRDFAIAESELTAQAFARMQETKSNLERMKVAYGNLKTVYERFDRGHFTLT